MTRLAILIASLALLAAQPVFSQPSQAEVEVDLPAQPLDATLKALADKHKLQILFSPNDVRGLKAPEIKGRYTIDTVLQKLTAGTNLVYAYNGQDTVVVRAKGSNDNTGPRGASTADPTAARGATSAAVKQEGIVVTAQKRSELLVDVPQSVTVLSADYLEKIGAVQFRDFANTVPGLTFTTTGPGRSQISLRGVTAGSDVSPTVGLYVDEVPFGSGTTRAAGAGLGLDLALFDLDHIEVLRGPQGTLYGSSSMGGLIKYVSKRPDVTRFRGEAQAGISSTNDGGTNYNVAAAVNAPVVQDTVALRASGFYSRDGGFTDNVTLGRRDVNRSRVTGGRLDLLLSPTSVFNVRIDALLQDIDRNGTGTADHDILSGRPLDGELDQRRNLAEPFSQRFRVVSATLGYEMDRASLTSISSYQRVETKNFADLSRLFTFLSLPSFGNRNYSGIGNDLDVTTKRFTQEVRLASERTKTFEWLVGGYYTRETSQNNSALQPFDLAGRAAPADVSNVEAPSRYEERAAFGDLTWRLTDRFDVTGGVRYARNELETSAHNSGILAGPSAATTRSSENVTTYLANARYHINDRATAYLRYATGYRPGGPNFTNRDPATGLPIGAPTFKSDKLKSYEGGVKAETADRRFSVDAAAYYIDWTDIQLFIVRTGFAGIVNAAGATIRGGELTVGARPLDGLALTGAFAYQDAELSEANADLHGAAGERLPNVPRFTAALNADYRLPLRDWNPTVGATLRYVSDRTSGFSGAPATNYHLPEYTSVDLRAGLTFHSVIAQFYVHNVFDKRGQLSALVLGAPTANVAILQPRTVGLAVRTTF